MEEVVIQIFPNMTVWKLHSLKEYLVFFLMLLGGFLVFRFWIRRMKKNRTWEGGRKRTLDAVKSGSRKDFTDISSYTFDFSPDSLCILLPHDILLLRVVYHGYRIQGSERSEQWKLKDNSGIISVPNPLQLLEKEREKLEKSLEAAHSPQLPIHTFVIGADNYAEPVFQLDEGARSHALSLPELKKWIRQRNLDPITEKKRQEILAVFGR